MRKAILYTRSATNAFAPSLSIRESEMKHIAKENGFESIELKWDIGAGQSLSVLEHLMDILESLETTSVLILHRLEDLGRDVSTIMDVVGKLDDSNVRLITLYPRMDSHQTDSKTARELLSGQIGR